MGDVVLDGDRVRIGPRFSLTFQRTLRVPDDGTEYPLPPGLGALPVRPAAPVLDRAPAHWTEGDLFLPLYQREALWLQFGGARWKPNAVQVGIGRVNAVSGAGWDEGLADRPQNYLVCPDQPWLDGINVAEGRIRQFVAVPLGAGATVEGQLTGREEHGGIQLRVFEPRPGRFPDEPPEEDLVLVASARPMAAAAGGMGLGAGGAIRQRIYPDPYGLDAWDPESATEVQVHVVNSEQYEDLTGSPPPPTPVDAATYTEHGLPWFELYDEDRGALEGSSRLAKVESVREHSGEPEDDSVAVRPEQVRRLRRRGDRRPDR